MSYLSTWTHSSSKQAPICGTVNLVRAALLCVLFLPTRPFRLTPLISTPPTPPHPTVAPAAVRMCALLCGCPDGLIVVFVSFILSPARLLNCVRRGIIRATQYYCQEPLASSAKRFVVECCVVWHCDSGGNVWFQTPPLPPNKRGRQRRVLTRS